MYIHIHVYTHTCIYTYRHLPPRRRSLGRAGGRPEVQGGRNRKSGGSGGTKQAESLRSKDVKKM